MKIKSILTDYALIWLYLNRYNIAMFLSYAMEFNTNS